MRDWKALVRERLDLTDLSVKEQKETIAELAGHLEDICEKYVASGSSDEEAVAHALDEVGSWRRLARSIHESKEGSMNTRTRRLWLPALTSIAVALVLPIVLLITFTHIHFKLWSAYSHWFNQIWLLASVMGGAVGAYLSRRAGGDRSSRVLSALSPIAVLVVAIGMVVGIMAVSQIAGGPSAPWREFARVGTMLTTNGTALLLGAMPFLMSRNSYGAEVPHA